MVLAEQPQVFCVLSGGLWCCGELGLGTSSRDVPWGAEWGQKYSFHAVPNATLCIPQVTSGVKNGLSQPGHPN